MSDPGNALVDYMADSVRCDRCGRQIDRKNDPFDSGRVIPGDGLESGPLFWGIERPARIVRCCCDCLSRQLEVPSSMEGPAA